jgi:hypothetical protein
MGHHVSILLYLMSAPATARRQSLRVGVEQVFELDSAQTLPFPEDQSSFDDTRQ